MKSFLLVAALALPLQAQALEFIKCNSVGGKTLWATFGKKVRSGDPAPTYFPVDLTLLRGKELVDRLLFNSSKDSAGLPVEATSATIHFAFPAKGADGNPEWQAFRLRLYSPGKSANAYVGEWAVGKDQLETKEQVFCSVY
jgi:hypothetical protein